MSRFEFNTTLNLRGDLQETLKIAQSQMSSTGTQLGSWLVVGNIAGVYFLSDAATHSYLVTDDRFTRLYALFVIGAALAFGGMCWTYFMSIPLVQLIVHISTQLLLSAQREQIEDDLKKVGVAMPSDLAKQEEDWQALMPALNQRLARTWLVFGGAVAIFILSAICFLVAIATPLWGGIAITPPK
jgi:hypothetical protein